MFGLGIAELLILLVVLSLSLLVPLSVVLAITLAMRKNKGAESPPSPSDKEMH